MLLIYDDKSKEEAKKQILLWKKNIEHIKKERIGCALWCVIFLMFGLIIARSNTTVTNIVLIIFIGLIISYFIRLRGIPKRIAIIEEMIKKGEEEILSYTRTQEVLIDAQKTIDMTNEILLKNRSKYTQLYDTESITSDFISTYLTGTNFHGRKKLLKQLQAEEADAYGYDKYDGLSRKELHDELEFGGKIWEYPPIDVELELIHEEDNIYDKNAIAVYAEIDYESTQIGYIPKEDNKDVLKLLSSGTYTAIGTLLGGKYKEYDFDEDKITTASSELSMEIRIEN